MTSIIVTNASMTLTDAEVQATVSALQAQVNKDLALAWGLPPSELNFVPRGTKGAGSWAMVVLDDSDQAEALGYHELTASGFPIAKIFARSCAQSSEDFRPCMSHELCEMLVDPNINSFVATIYAGRQVTTIQEVCDPVEGDTYLIAGMPMSNFVLPEFYSRQAMPNGRYDFLGRLKAPMTMDTGGYMSFRDENGDWSQIFGMKPTSWRSRVYSGSRRERLRLVRYRWRRSTAV